MLLPAAYGNKINVQVRSCFVKVHYGVKNLEVRITFFKITHIFFKHGFRCFPIFRTDAAILGIPEHHDYFLKQLFFFAFSDMLIVVLDLSVGSILPSVIFVESFVKKFAVQFTQVAFNIGYVVRRSGFIHVIREEIPVVMLNAAVV